MRKLKPMEIRGMHPNVIQLSSTGWSAVGVILGTLEVYTGCIITSERFLPVCFTFGFKMEYTLIYGHYTQK